MFKLPWNSIINKNEIKCECITPFGTKLLVYEKNGDIKAIIEGNNYYNQIYKDDNYSNFSSIEEAKKFLEDEYLNQLFSFLNLKSSMSVIDQCLDMADKLLNKKDV